MSDKIIPTTSAPAAWLHALAEGEADLANGRGSPLPEARARLVALIDEVETEPLTFPS
jgi:hypothetical protein